MKKALKKRRSSLFASIKREVSFSQSVEEDDFPFSQDSSVKAWTSMDDLDVSFTENKESGQGAKDGGRKELKSALRQPNIVNVNVGGKVFHIPKHLVLRYPKTRIGILALCKDPAKRLTLCDDFNFQKNEFFFDRDPMFFHYIFHFYCSNVLWVMESLCPINFEEEVKFWGLRMRDSPRYVAPTPHVFSCVDTSLTLCNSVVSFGCPGWPPQRLIYVIHIYEKRRLTCVSSQVLPHSFRGEGGRHQGSAEGEPGAYQRD